MTIAMERCAVPLRRSPQEVPATVNTAQGCPGFEQRRASAATLTDAVLVPEVS
ncbi:hypothetical protein [Streptomyces europaeiscabiei]|uniref:hypothetical protein n=1 Tax=Streptomyces europaeiscabiei TaxID=146819 RepID=UPI001F08DD94|nr:hypothetical protein [Streptomyces europaeiscabiei]MDX2530504.1 hypothetical protein [Streptomyces europaeiscabiei]MDX2761862.1 hypothetical protein [Streptomyces europaeiscabiei]MDX2773101.1 hypothetical protein [Streptomyces europaeiscabiei]MDX3715495.1 hypothetical protein [Streptomyces europaeiscabiei]MDX3783339.1 hypothetical protein [Streptomyces europaeiscabiei]